MGTTLETLKNEIKVHKNYKDLVQVEWEQKIEDKKLHRRAQKDFDHWKTIYVKKIDKIREQLRGDWKVTVKPQNADGSSRTAEQIVADFSDELQHLTEKEIRLFDKLACVLEEEQLRKDGKVVRDDIHEATDYYIDYTNGIDTAHGEKLGNFTADAGTNTTTIVDTELNGLSITDNASSSGDWVWNVTRSAGSYVDAWDDGTDTITLTGTITGQTTGDTYYIIPAWKTFQKALETTTLTAGDRVFMRSGITWSQGTVARDILMDDDGDEDDYISLIGCDGTDHNEWGDDDSTKPIIDFEDLSYQIYSLTDDFWFFDNFEVKQSNDGYSTVCYSNHTYWKDIDFSDQPGSGSFYMADNDGFVTFEGCTFEDDDVYGILVGTGLMHCISCTFTAGSVRPSDYGIRAYNDCQIMWLEDCTFTGSFASADILVEDNVTLYMRNTSYTTLTVTDNGEAHSEDDGATFEDQEIKRSWGTITRDTTDARSGGADSFATLAPKAACGVNRMLRLGNKMSGFSRVWASASVEITVTVHVRDPDDWATQPGNNSSQGTFYIETSHLSNGASAARTLTRSTQDTVYNTWTAFTTTFTPARDGWVYIWAYLGAFETSKTLDIDIKPVVS